MMFLQRRYVLVRWCILAGLLVLVVKSGLDVISHPAVLTTAGGALPVYLALFAAALLIYGWFALFRIRTDTPAARIAAQQGTLWGLLCGAMWIFEVLEANVFGAGLGSLNVVLYVGSAVTAYLLPGVAVLLAGWRAGQMKAGLHAGLLAGMLGGLLLFLVTLFPLFPLLVGTNQPDAQTLQEFHRSGLPDLQTFLLGDWLAALIAHLWIGLITGFLLGLVGGALGKALAAPGAAAEAPTFKR
jgi:hypothetical protein